MPSDHNPDENHRLSDGREDIGDSLAHPIPREDRALGEDFTHRNAYDGPGLGEEFADPIHRRRARHGRSLRRPQLHR